MHEENTAKELLTARKLCYSRRFIMPEKCKQPKQVGFMRYKHAREEWENFPNNRETFFGINGPSCQVSNFLRSPATR